MDEKAFSEAIALLSGEHSLAILRSLASGEWRIATDVSRALDIHTTTASKFLSGMHTLGFLERRVRKSRTRSAFEYRLSATRLALDLDLSAGPAPIREATDFYLEYVTKVVEKARRLGWPGIAEKLEARLEKSRDGRREHVFNRIIEGGGARGMDELRMLFQEIHKEFLEIASESVGQPTARRLLSGVADEARKGRADIVDRYGLRKALEA
jgi:DNA-binding HxlR family transcriptional regulator